MSHSLNSLQRVLYSYAGNCIGEYGSGCKGDTRSLDYSSYGSGDVEGYVGFRTRRLFWNGHMAVVTGGVRG